MNKTKNMTYFYIVGFLPQYLFVCDENKNIIVDEVINIKNIDNYLTKYSDNSEVKQLNTHLHTNENYTKYLSQDNINVIMKIYKDDYEIFNQYF